MPTKIFSQSSGGGAASSVAWGAITGTLSSQTDLQAALDLKAPLDSPTFTTKVTLSYATASTVVVLNASKALVSTNTTYNTASDVMDFGTTAGAGIKVAGALLTSATSTRPTLNLASGGRFFMNDGGNFLQMYAAEWQFGTAGFTHGWYVDSSTAVQDFGMLNNDGAFTFHVHAGTIMPLGSNASGLLTLGDNSATLQQHALAITLATNGAAVKTMTNGPTAITGADPAIWIKMTVNGTTTYIPGWQ